MRSAFRTVLGLAVVWSFAACDRPPEPAPPQAPPTASDAAKRFFQGYRGDYSFEVFNDDYQQIPLPDVARRARKAADWLGEGILRRSVPLPGAMRLQTAG